MRDSRQITVLRSLFRTLHPKLASARLRSGIESGLAPARRMLTGSDQPSDHSQTSAQTSAQSSQEETLAEGESRAPGRAASRPQKHLDEHGSSAAEQALPQKPARPKVLPPLPRSLTDEHLVSELDNVTRQYELAGTATIKPELRKPRRGSRHISRDTLLSLLEEAKVRIQVLETELELARGTEEHIPLLTEEWSDDLPSTFSRKPD